MKDEEQDRDFGTDYPRLKGRCPACGSSTLFRGSHGYITCSWLKCPNPGAAHDALVAQPPADSPGKSIEGATRSTPAPPRYERTSKAELYLVVEASTQRKVYATTDDVEAQRVLDSLNQETQSLETLKAEVNRLDGKEDLLRDQIQQLRRAIDPSGKVWPLSALVALADAHRSDSEDRDRYEGAVPAPPPARGALTVKDLQLAASIVGDAANEARESADEDKVTEAPILSKLCRDLDIAAFELNRAAVPPGAAEGREQALQQALCEVLPLLERVASERENECGHIFDDYGISRAEVNTLIDELRRVAPTGPRDEKETK